MKKRVRKLSLNRETLRHLQNEKFLKAVGGGAGTTENCDEASWCACETETGCPGTHLMTQPCTLATRCAC